MNACNIFHLQLRFLLGEQVRTVKKQEHCLFLCILSGKTVHVQLQYSVYQKQLEHLHVNKM